MAVQVNMEMQTAPNSKVVCFLHLEGQIIDQGCFTQKGNKLWVTLLGLSELPG